MMNRITETSRKPSNQQREGIHFDDKGVTRVMAGGDDETVRWDELQQVAIVTTDEGPFLEDVFWLLFGKDEGGCLIPGAEMHDALLDRLQQLPGFDNDAVIAAMSSTDDASFLCWRRSQEVA